MKDQIIKIISTIAVQVLSELAEAAEDLFWKKSKK
jgi:hypothetical protein